VIASFFKKKQSLYNILTGEKQVMNKKILAKLKNFFFDNFEENIMFFFMSIMFFSVLFQILFRYILEKPLVFTEEVARCSYMWIGSLCLAKGLKDGSHIDITIFTSKLLSKKNILLLDIMINIISLIIISYLFYESFSFFTFFKPLLLPSLRISRGFVAISIVIGYGYAILRLIILLIDKYKKIILAKSTKINL